MLALSEFRNKAQGLPDLLMYAAMVKPGVHLGKDGRLCAGWFYRGADSQASTAEEMRNAMALVNSALTRLGDGWMLTADAIRDYSREYPESRFPDRTSATVDAERRQQYTAEGAHYESIYALTLSWRPPAKVASKAKAWMYDNSNRKEDDAGMADRLLEQFERTVEEVTGMLGSVLQMRRMLPYTVGHDHAGREMVCEELLEFFELCITGEKRPVRLPACPMYLDTVIGNHEFVAGENLQVGRKHVRVVAIDGLPGESYPAILERLDGMAFPYRWSSRFIFLDNYQARGTIESVRKIWKGKQRGLKDQMFNTANGPVDLDALAMTMDAEQAVAAVESGLLKFGYYTSVIVLHHEDETTVDGWARDAEKLIRNLGFGARIEGVNAVEAFLGSLPPHDYPNIRRMPLHTLNVADFLPTSSVWPGHEFHPSALYPPKSPPLFLATSTGATPFRVTPFEDDLGHHLVIGPPGAGKTTLLNFMILSHKRYPRSRVFGLDRKRGMYATISAIGGTYYDIGGTDSRYNFCPLDAIDDPAEQSWAAEYLAMLVELYRESTNSPGISGAERQSLYQAVRRFADAAPRGRRSLTSYLGTLDDPRLKEAIQSYTLAGEFGMLLDEETDTLEDADDVAFELENVVERGPRIAVPILVYLLHRADRRLTGAPTFIPIDESWALLKSKMFGGEDGFIAKYLRTTRSKNAYVGLFTQYPQEIVESAIADVLLASCPTRILLANAEATRDQAEVYGRLGLNSRERELVSTMVRKRQYYFRNPSGRRLFNLALGRVALAFAGATSKDDVKAIESMIQRYGQKWPAMWLREKGLDPWATYWEGLK